MNGFLFERLKVYQESRMFVKEVYILLRKFPEEERYSLADQMRRAAISVTSNIAEGVSRIAIKEKQHFLDIAYSSLLEVYSQVRLAADLQYITEQEYNNIKPKVYLISKMLLALKNSFNRHSNEP